MRALLVAIVLLGAGCKGGVIDHAAPTRRAGFTNASTAGYTALPKPGYTAPYALPSRGAAPARPAR